jgi:hypothetical protein
VSSIGTGGGRSTGPPLLLSLLVASLDVGDTLVLVSSVLAIVLELLVVPSIAAGGSFGQATSTASAASSDVREDDPTRPSYQGARPRAAPTRWSVWPRRDLTNRSTPRHVA